MESYILLYACMFISRFTFIMGTSIALAFNGMARRKVPMLSLMGKTLKRTAILFALGIIISNMDGRE